MSQPNQEKALDELTEIELETNDKEIFSYCEQLREKLASNPFEKIREDNLHHGIENNCELERRSNETNGEA